MNPEQALKVIEEALNHATTKGAFNLNDASHVVNALITLKKVVEPEKTIEPKKEK
jgi:hypothetical protein